MVCFPSLECQTRARTVFSVARRLGLYDQLRGRLYYLSTYANRPGCTYDKLAGVGNTRCELYPDFAPYSFQFAMRRFLTKSGVWDGWFNGGLILNHPQLSACDGTFPTLCVTLDTSVGWQVHT
jgi:hypothetical protein